jgi:DNA primase
MSKLAPTSTKYLIKAQIKAKGVVEKPDIIGAIFGQTEGLLGSDLDLRELQRTGRIGRIEVNIKSNQGNSEGEIIIPSSLDSAETALIAATIETIERVGPCNAKIKLISVEDMRSEKRKYVVEKAKEILKNLVEKGVPDTTEISEQIKEAIRSEEVTSYHGLAAGPGVIESDDIVIVEGRADVLNLLRYGIKNAVAIEGTSMPPAAVELARQKVVTLFVDGDRGGQLIAKELSQVAEIEFIAVAPEGKEVEDLTKKEVYKALRDKVSADQFFHEIKNRNGNNQGGYEKESKKEEPKKRDEKTSYGYSERRDDRRGFRRDRFRKRDSRHDSSRREQRREPRQARISPQQKELFRKTLDDLVGTRAACIFNENNELMGKVPVSELMNTIRTLDNPYAIVMDGVVDAKLNSLAKMKGVRFLVGMEKEDFPTYITVLCRKDLE